jgi:prepilin-type N-terminal cleavage/methylation domain-containing protein
MIICKTKINKSEDIMQKMRMGFTLKEVLATILLLGIIAYFLSINTINTLYETYYFNGLRSSIKFGTFHYIAEIFS